MKGPLSRSSPTSFTPGKRDQQSSSAMALVWKSVGLWRVGCTAGVGSLPSGDGDTAAVLGGGGRCVLCVLLSTGLRGSPALCVHMSVRRLTRHMGGHRLRAPPLREGVRETQGEHNKNHRSRGIIAKDQEDVQLFFHYQIVKKKNKKKPRKTKKTEQNPSGFVAGEATLAVAARRCGRCDFQVLAENGLEGLVSMHHGTEHQRFLG